MKMFVCIIVRSGGSWVRAVIWVAYNNFPTNRKCSGQFLWFIGSYGFGDIRSSGARTTDSRHGNLYIYFRRVRLSISGSCRVSVFGQIFTSGIATELYGLPVCVTWGPHCDFDSTRLTSHRTWHCYHGRRISFRAGFARGVGGGFDPQDRSLTPPAKVGQMYWGL